MDQIHANTNLHCYKLQPGDATCYRFGMMFPNWNAEFSEMGHGWDSEKTSETIYGNKVEKLVGDPEQAYAYDTFSGIGKGQDYIFVYIDMGGNGWTYYAAWDLTSYPLGEIPMFVMTGAMSRMPQVDKYTVVAITLALQVLIDHPEDVEGAMHNMLYAPKYIIELSKRMHEEEQEEE